MATLRFVANSDLGVANTIGARVEPLLREGLRRGCDVRAYCRGARRDLLAHARVFPLGRPAMRALSAVPIYLWKGFPADALKSALFERYLMLHGGDLAAADIVHAWDYVPRVLSRVKSASAAKVVLDVAMALPSILTGNPEAERLWQGERLDLPRFVSDALRVADVLLVPSEFVRESLTAEGVPEEHIRLVPFGVDVREFRVAEPSPKPVRFAFVGNVNNRKGVPYLIEAWDSLHLHDAELHLYGHVYPEVAGLLRDAERRRIHIHGFVDIARELNKNHVFVLPSLLEGSAKATYEALASGLPVITTRNAGSIVSDGVEGYVVQPMNASALAHRMQELGTDATLRSVMGQRARQQAERYTWEQYASRVWKVYDELLRLDDGPRTSFFRARVRAGL